jgi:phasin family protein
MTESTPENAMLTPEQLAAAHKAHIEMLYGLTQKAFEGVEKLVELNLQATRAALQDAADESQALLSAKDAQELLQRQAALLQPLVEKSVTYSRQLAEIAASTQSAFTQAAEQQAQDWQQKTEAVMDNVARNAPAGTEAAVQAMRQIVNAASTAMQTVQQALKQAAELTEKNMQAGAQMVSDLARAPEPVKTKGSARSKRPEN